MTVSVTKDGAIELSGHCGVEDAEALQQRLLAAPRSTVEWSSCEHLHSAVIQVLLVGRTPHSRSACECFSENPHRTARAPFGEERHDVQTADRRRQQARANGGRESAEQLLSGLAARRSRQRGRCTERHGRDAPDIALVDFNMPTRDGLHLAADLRKHNPQMPIGIISANHQREVIDRAAALGATFLPKPLADKALLEFLTRRCATCRARRQ